MMPTMSHYRPRRLADQTGPGTFEILLSALSVVLLTIAASTLGWWLTDQPDSEFPAWLEAGATLAAVGAAIVAGFYAARAFGLEFAREERWEDQQQAAQASLVAAWPTLPHFRSLGGERRIHAVEGLVRNASELPVRDVRIVFYVTWRDSESGQHKDVEALGEAHLSYLGPNQEAQKFGYFALDQKGGGKTLPAPMDESVELNVETFFRDSAGVGWFRDLDGRLAPMAEYVMPPH